MNLLPLCTAKVWPTNSGVIVERRAHVFNTRLSALRFIVSILETRLATTYGHFLTDRVICFSSSRSTCSNPSSACASCTPYWACPTASRDGVRQTTCLRLRPSDDRPDSLPHRDCAGGGQASACARLSPCSRSALPHS